MKNKKLVKEFSYFGLTKEEVKDLLNKEEPLNIKKLEPIIESIYLKYPLITKTEISIIVKATLESMRDFLVLGYVMNFNKFIFDMKINFYTHVIEGRVNPALKIKLKTPPKFKELK